MVLESRERETAIWMAETLVKAGLGFHMSEGDMCEWFYETTELRGFNYNNGVTKACFYHPQLEDWVLKVGFTRNMKKNYMTVEYDNYCKAVEQGLSYYFPHTEFLCEIMGIKFYIQQAAECDEDTVTSDWYDKLLVWHEENGDDLDNDRIWDEVYEMEDVEKIELMFGDGELNEFLKENRIGDFHEGNFGFIGDRTVIIDFSGYHG